MSFRLRHRFHTSNAARAAQRFRTLGLCIAPARRGCSTPRYSLCRTGPQIHAIIESINFFLDSRLRGNDEFEGRVSFRPGCIGSEMDSAITGWVRGLQMDSAAPKWMQWSQNGFGGAKMDAANRHAFNTFNNIVNFFYN